MSLSSNILHSRPILFIKRRISEFLGIVSLLGTFYILVSLATWSPQDPSFTHTVYPLTHIHNWGKLPGAYLSNFLYKNIGLATFALLTFPLSWGWRRIRHLPETRPLLRLSFCLLSFLFFWTALGAFPSTHSPLQESFGGVAGAALYGILANFFTSTLLLKDLWVHKALVIVGFGGGALFLILSVPSLLKVFSLGWRFLRYALHSPDQKKYVTKEKEQEKKTPFFFKVLHFLGAPFKGIFSLNEEDQDLVLEARRDLKNTPDKTRHSQRQQENATLAATRAQERANREQQRLISAKQESSRLKNETKKERASEDQNEPSSSSTYFQLPPLSLLEKPHVEKAINTKRDQELLDTTSQKLENVLKEFSIHGRMLGASAGPVVTLYEFEPSPGTKTSRIISLADDVARSMSMLSARICVIPGRNAVGIELPNASRKTVLLRSILEAPTFKSNAALPLALGQDIAGAPVVVDLARMPHLLIAGTTGSGKSVGINAMILSLLYHLRPEQCRMIFIDPKMLELSLYNDIPHLLTPVVTNPKKAIVALRWVVSEMEKRYAFMAKMGTRNISGYNERIKRNGAKGKDALPSMPYIVVVIDEMADLMMVAGKDIEAAVQRLAQMARASGIHMIMATQRPSVDVITGTIKANFPTRISFQVTSKIDSRTILGEQGAEQLLGQGDMLYMMGGGRIKRLHGAFVSDPEIENITKHLKAQGQLGYLEDVVHEEENEKQMKNTQGAGGDDEDLYEKAFQVVTTHKRASISYIQRRLRIGYNRAAHLMEQLEERGVVSAPNHQGKREILEKETKNTHEN